MAQEKNKVPAQVYIDCTPFKEGASVVMATRERSSKDDTVFIPEGIVKMLKLVTEAETLIAVGCMFEKAAESPAAKLNPLATRMYAQLADGIAADVKRIMKEMEALSRVSP